MWGEGAEGEGKRRAMAIQGSEREGKGRRARE